MLLNERDIGHDDDEDEDQDDDDENDDFIWT